MLLGILLAIIIIVSIALVAIILLQRSEGGALGMSGGGPGNFMTARGTGDLLTRTTQILGAIFFVLCLTMTLISGHNRASNSVVDRLKINGLDPSALSAQRPQPANAAAGQALPAAPMPLPTAPAQGSAPASGTGLFGEAAPAGHAKSANPLANITVQSSAPPAGK